jgi:hypothetical protein
LGRITYTLFDVLFFVVFTIEVVIEHAFEVCVVAFVARTFIIDSVGKKGVEAEANQIGFAELR